GLWMPHKRIIEGPHPDLAHAYSEDALESFRKAANVPRRAMNYASHLLFDIPSENDEIADHVAVSAFLLRNAIVRCDGTCELLQLGAANTSGILFRSLLETVFSSLYLFKDERSLEFKALCYRYCHIRQFIKNARGL